MTSSRNTTIPMVASESVMPFAQFLAARDLDPSRWLQKANIPMAELRRPDGLVTLHSCYRFLDIFVRDSRNFRLPVLVSKEVSPLKLGSFGRALCPARTVGDYLRLGSRLVTMLSNSGMEIKLHHEDGRLRVSHSTAPAPGYGPAIADVYTLAVTLRFLRSIFGQEWRPEVVELRRHVESFLEDGDIRATDCVLTGRRQTSFTLPITLLEHPLPDSRALSVSPLESKGTVIPGTLPDVLDRLVSSALDEGRTDIRSVARLVGMSPRALQRRLACWETDYRTLLNHCRVRHASEWLLSSNRSVAEIAAELGYTDASNFARAYRRATGYAPAEWRRIGCTQKNPGVQRSATREAH